MKKLAATLTGLLLIGMAPNSALARPHFSTPMPSNGFVSNFVPPMSRYADKGQILSLREVAQILNQSVPGRLSDAQLVNDGGRQVYVVRWEPSENRGRIIEFVVDAETGKILSRRG
jgi:hypothetical protein